MSPWAWLAMIPAAAAVLAILVARRRFVVVRVSGTSMAPALLPGDRVLVRRGPGDQIRVGAVVVLPQPPYYTMPTQIQKTGPSRRRFRPRRSAYGGDWVIKRVAAMSGDAVPEPVRRAVGGVTVVPPGMLVVLGDNTRSTDSRFWGFLSADRVLGAVVRRLPAQTARSGGWANAAGGWAGTTGG